MYAAADLRKGLKVEIDGQPYVITEFQFNKPGKGQAIYNCRLKNLLTGATLTRSYRSNDRIDEARLASKNLRYSYPQGHHYVFMDENYEEVFIESDVLGDDGLLLTEDSAVDVLFHDDRAVSVTLPTFVEKAVAHTEPGVRGDTATNVLKPARLAGGFEVQVPLFVNEGDVVRIDTRTGEYVERVEKG